MDLLQRPLQLACTVLLCYALIACGGGGGGGGGGSDTASSSSSSGSQTVVTPPPASGGTPTDPDPIDPEPEPEPEPTPPAKTSVTLSWVAPTTRQNGAPLLPSELAGYEIYYFQEDSAVEDGQILIINDANATEATIDELTPGTYFFAIATIDSDGLESDISDYVEAQID
jgi:hypothetical protein